MIEYTGEKAIIFVLGIIAGIFIGDFLERWKDKLLIRSGIIKEKKKEKV